MSKKSIDNESSKEPVSKEIPKNTENNGTLESQETAKKPENNEISKDFWEEELLNPIYYEGLMKLDCISLAERRSRRTSIVEEILEFKNSIIDFFDHTFKKGKGHGSLNRKAIANEKTEESEDEDTTLYDDEISEESEDDETSEELEEEEVSEESVEEEIPEDEVVPDEEEPEDDVEKILMTLDCISLEDPRPRRTSGIEEIGQLRENLAEFFEDSIKRGDGHGTLAYKPPVMKVSTLYFNVTNTLTSKYNRMDWKTLVGLTQRRIKRRRKKPEEEICANVIARWKSIKIDSENTEEC